MAVLSKEEVQKARAGKHGDRAWTCPLCVKACRGNGGRSSHISKHLRDAGLPKGEWGYLLRHPELAVTKRG